MRDICGRLSLLVVTVFVFVSCGASPTAPSGNTTTPPNLATSVSIGSASFTVTSAYFWRDWMPVVGNPGPDGGSPLMAVINVTIDNAGAADRATLLCTVRDSSGKNYLVTTTVVNAATGKDWDGTILPNTRTNLSITLRDGPYLPVKSTVMAVLTWNNGSTRVASMRTPEVQVQQTM